MVVRTEGQIPSSVLAGSYPGLPAARCDAFSPMRATSFKVSTSAFSADGIATLGVPDGRQRSLAWLHVVELNRLSAMVT
jgi:hypothetical protein